MQALSQLSYSPTRGRGANVRDAPRTVKEMARWNPPGVPSPALRPRSWPIQGDKKMDTIRMAGRAGAVLLGLMALGALAADASGITGTWTTSFESQVGTQTYTYTFKVEGD